MGFRRKSEEALVWKKWQQANADLILASGVESYAFEKADTWWEYLQHRSYLPTSEQEVDALRKLVLSWPGGSDTSLGSVLGLRHYIPSTRDS